MMKKIVFGGVLVFFSFMLFKGGIGSKQVLSDAFLENMEALSESEVPDTDPGCLGTGSVDCSKWEYGKVVTVKVEKKTSGDYSKSRRIVY